MTKEEWNTFFASHWNFDGAKQDRHIAVFPEELPHRLIKMFSFAGETVFDPFMGSGTTALAARNLQRNSIEYEKSPDYKKILYKEKVASSCSFDSVEYRYSNDKSVFYIDEKMKTLPYIFSDPHKLESKIEIKKLQKWENLMFCR